MISLEKKKILLFAPKFFNYEIAIKDEMERQGADVHLYDERNNPSSVEKILLRKAHFLMESKISQYYSYICEKEKDYNPDYVLFISPESINKKSILHMRKVFPDAKFILYMYDSIQNKNARKVYKFYDVCYSFDPNDCKKYGFMFRPLFFIKKFETESLESIYRYDFAFIGSVHSDRAKILNSLRKYFIANNLNFFYYLYVPGNLILFLRCLLDRNLYEMRHDCVYLTPLSKDMVVDILSKTNYVIDINHPKQVGLTMRTIEMLGLRKKILTTNMHIRDYDFFDESNQILIDRKNIFINTNLISADYKAISNDIYDRYRLSSWVKEILQ